VTAPPKLEYKLVDRTNRLESTDRLKLALDEASVVEVGLSQVSPIEETSRIFGAWCADSSVAGARNHQALDYPDYDMIFEERVRRQ
jgi:hypothetical protein